MAQPTANPDPEDADLRVTVRQAHREGADTAGLDEAVAASNDSVAEAREMAEEADEHIQAARRQLDLDREMSPERGRHFYESGSEHAELDDQSIAPPG